MSSGPYRLRVCDVNPARNLLLRVNLFITWVCVCRQLPKPETESKQTASGEGGGGSRSSSTSSDDSVDTAPKTQSRYIGEGDTLMGHVNVCIVYSVLCIWLKDLLYVVGRCIVHSWNVYCERCGWKMYSWKVELKMWH